MSKVAGLTLAGATPPKADDTDENPPPRKVAKKAAAKKVTTISSEANPFAVPALPAKAGKVKGSYYVDKAVHDELDEIVRYAKFHFGVGQGEAQQIVFRLGLDNKAEVMRELRIAAGAEEDGE